MPAGTALTLLAGPLWLPEFGWRTWWLLFAVLSWAMAFVLWRVVPADVSTSFGTEPVNASSVKAVAWTQRLRETLSAPGPWWVALCFAMYSGQWLAVVGFLPSIYTQAGLLGATLGLLTAVAAAVNMLGNMASGRLLQEGVHPSALLAMGFSAMGAGALLAFAEFTQSWPWLRYAGVLLFQPVVAWFPALYFLWQCVWRRMNAMCPPQWVGCSKAQRLGSLQGRLRWLGWRRKWVVGNGLG